MILMIFLISTIVLMSTFSKPFPIFAPLQFFTGCGDCGDFEDLDDFDDPDDKQNKNSVTSIPKTGSTGRKKGGGLKSQPQA